MARIGKVEDSKNVRLTITCDQPEARLDLVWGNKRAYLHIWRPGDGPITISGERVLRRLATDLFKELEGKP